MGIDVMFYIEARKRPSGKWHYVPYKRYDPEKEEKAVARPDGWLDEGIWLGRYYHISDSLEEMPSQRCGLPSDCSDELREMFKRACARDFNDDYGSRDIYSVSFIDVVEACDKLEKELLDAFHFIATHDIVKRLDRIECAIRGEDAGRIDERKYECAYATMAEALEDFRSDNYSLFRLRPVVSVLVGDYSEVRLIYVLC